MRVSEFSRFLKPLALRRTIDFQALTVLFPNGTAQDTCEFTSDLTKCLVDSFGVPAIKKVLGIAAGISTKSEVPADPEDLVREALRQLESRTCVIPGAENRERIYMRPAEMYFEYLVDVPFFAPEYNPRIKDFVVDKNLRDFQKDSLVMMRGKLDPSGKPAGTFFKTSFRLDWTWASYFTGVIRVKKGSETYYCVHGYNGDPVILNNFYMTRDTRAAVVAEFRTLTDNTNNTDNSESLSLRPDWDKISYEFEQVKFECVPCAPGKSRMPAGIPDVWKTALRKITSETPVDIIVKVLDSDLNANADLNAGRGPQGSKGPNVTSYDEYVFMLQFSFLFPVAVVPDMCNIGKFIVVDYLLFRRLAEYTLDMAGISSPMSWSFPMKLTYTEIEVPVPKNATFVQCSDSCNARIAEIAGSSDPGPGPNSIQNRILVICNDDKHKKKLEGLIKNKTKIECIDNLVNYTVPDSVDTFVTSVYRGMNRVMNLTLPDRTFRFITVHGGALTGILYSD